EFRRSLSLPVAAALPLARRPIGSYSAIDREEQMEFGYFTLSDNHYDDNRREANQFVADILDEAVYAEEVGLHSAWIGEHHFSTLGVLSCPDLVLARRWHRGVRCRVRRVSGVRAGWSETR